MDVLWLSTITAHVAVLWALIRSGAVLRVQMFSVAIAVSLAESIPLYQSLSSDTYYKIWLLYQVVNSALYLAAIWESRDGFMVTVLATYLGGKVIAFGLQGFGYPWGAYWAWEILRGANLVSLILWTFHIATNGGLTYVRPRKEAAS